MKAVKSKSIPVFKISNFLGAARVRTVTLAVISGSA
jgi:hypothetical protein